MPARIFYKNSFIIAFFLTKFQIITCAPEYKNKAQKQDNGILTADALPPEPVMTLEAAAYPKLKKIKTELDSQMEYRKEGVNMGLPSLSEYTIYRTREAAVRAARNALDR